MSTIKRYWPEILVIGIIFGVLLNNLSPDVTWMNTDSDGAHYILAAKYLQPAHNTSAPFYLLLSRLFLFLPISNDAFRMGLISVLSTILACFIIYKIVMLHANNRVYGIIAMLVYGSSALVISQSTIIETYPFVTMLMLAGYYFIQREKWVLASVMFGIGFATHPLLTVMMYGIVFLFHREMRQWRRVAITMSFAVFYIYLPITRLIHAEPSMWSNTNLEGFFSGNFGTLFMLTGGLSIWDLPKRVIDTIGILGVSLGVGSLVVLIFFIRQRKWKYDLMVLTLVPAVYFMANLAAETYVYLIVTVAFASVAVGIALSKMNGWWFYATGIVAIGLFAFNANYFDIGRTLDPEMSATKFYHEELAKIPDGQYYMGGGWTWAMVFYYNKEEGRNIIPICTDIIPSRKYIDLLQSQGIDAIYIEDASYIDKEGKGALYIAQNNPNVWIAQVTKPEVYQYTVVPANDHLEYIGRWIGQDIEPGNWRWQPSNPYKFITGALEVAEWHHILWSNRSVLFIGAFAVGGYFVWWLILRVWDNRKRRHVSIREEAARPQEK